MRFYSEKLTLATGTPIEIIDITKDVAAIVQRARVRNGFAVVATHHTTSAIRINEPCANLAEDLTVFFEKLVPRNDTYQHNVKSVDGRPNAHSHLLAWLMGASENIPLRNGELLLGRWQSLFFVELDGPRPERHVTATIIGE